MLTIGFGVLENGSKIVLLISDETSLKSWITLDEAYWVISLVGAFFGVMLFGFVINYFGRKMPLMLIAIPMIVILEMLEEYTW